MEHCWHDTKDGFRFCCNCQVTDPNKLVFENNVFAAGSDEDIGIRLGIGPCPELVKEDG